MRQLVPFKIQEKAFVKSVTAQEIEAAPTAGHGALTTKILQQLLIDFYDIKHDDFQTKNTSGGRKKLIDTAHAKFLSESTPSAPPPPSSSHVPNNLSNSDYSRHLRHPPNNSNSSNNNNNNSSSSSPEHPSSG
jgi:hypothetical protein